MLQPNRPRKSTPRSNASRNPPTQSGPGLAGMASAAEQPEWIELMGHKVIRIIKISFYRRGTGRFYGAGGEDVATSSLQSN